MTTEISRARFVAGLSVVAASGNATKAYAQASPAIVLAAAGNDSTTSAVYAVKAGLFQKVGLDVQISDMRGGGAVAAGVLGGAVQIGHSSLLDIIVAHTKHIPLTLIAPSGMIDSSDADSVQLVVRKNSVIRSARDLNGKVFAVTALKDFTWLAASAWMDRNGGDSSSLRFIELSPAATVAAIGEGRADAAILSTPVLTQGLENGTFRALGNPFSAVTKRYMQVAWFTTEDYAERHQDDVRRFARVMHDSALFCNSHHAQTVDLIAEFGHLEPELVRRMPRITFAPYLDAPLIQPVIDTAYQYRAIEAPFDAHELISRYALQPQHR